MYKCENCSKPPYKTHKRYLNHIKTCGQNKQLNSIRSTRSTRSRDTTSYSKKSQKSLRQRTASIESLDSVGSIEEYTKSRTSVKSKSSKYSDHDLVKKLTKENKKYASKLKDLLKEEDELKHYYNKKIAILEEEKNILDRELRHTRKNRKNDSKEVEALQYTIDQLENSLNLKTQEAMQMSKEHAQLQGHLNEEIKRYENQLIAVNQQLTRERIVNRQLKDKAMQDIEEYQKSIEDQKCTEINTLQQEKVEMQKKWENKRKEIINRIQELENKQKNEIKEITAGYESRLRLQKEDESKLRISYKETLNREKQIAANRMERYKEEKLQEIKEIEEKHRKEIQKMTEIYEKKIAEKITIVQLKSSDISKECEALKLQMEENKRIAEVEQEKKIEDLKREFKYEYENFQNRMEGEKKKIKENFDSEVEKKEKEIKNINKLYEKVKYEYNYYKDLATRLTKTNEQFNDQYLTNFNNQSESHKLVIQEKDKRINELEKDLSSTRKNFHERIEILGKELKEKYTQVNTLENGMKEFRDMNDKYKQEKTNILNRSKKQIEILQEEKRELQEIKENNQRLIFELEKQLKDVDVKENEYKNKIKENEARISRYVSQIKDLQSETRSSIDARKHVEMRYEIIREELEEAKKERDINYCNLTQIQLEYKNKEKEFNEIASKYENMINDLETKLTHKTNQYNILQTHTRQILKSASEEREKMKKNYLETLDEYTKNIEKTIKIKEIEVMNANKYAQKASEKIQEYKSKLENKEKQLQEALKKANETPILSLRATKIDDAMKRGRDEALRKIRLQKEDITKLEVINKKLKIDLNRYQDQLKAKESEFERMLSTQDGLKQQYVTILNEREQKHKSELTEKDRRIHELETIMTSKLKLAEASKE